MAALLTYNPSKRVTAQVLKSAPYSIESICYIVTQYAIELLCARPLTSESLWQAEASLNHPWLDGGAEDKVLLLSSSSASSSFSSSFSSSASSSSSLLFLL